MSRSKKPADLNAKAFSNPSIFVYSADGLTPRSAHVKSESDEVEDQDHFTDPHDQQREPLLLSSSQSSQSPDKALPDPHFPLFNTVQLLRRIPLALGVLVAALLIFLAVLSYRNPELLLTVVMEQELESPTSQESVDAPITSSLPSSPLHDSQLIDYSNYSSFPLQPLQYAAECWKVFHSHTPQSGYWNPPTDGPIDVLHAKDISANFCASTITYQLDEYVGLMAHLALLGQIAAIADERNRTLFVDDRFWNRGKWTDHFEDIRKTLPGPQPGCNPPPSDELVACPRTAQHWVINSRTAKHHFGEQFENQYHDAYAQSLNRLHPLYNMASTSLQSTIVPNVQVMKLIGIARKEIGKGLYFGVHVRRGDRKAMKRKYRGQYLPLALYTDSVVDNWNKLPDVVSEKAAPSPTIWIASDSAAAVDEMHSTLGHKAKVLSLKGSRNKELQLLQPFAEYNQSTWNDLTLDQRRRETFGMMVDFAMISGAWPSKEDDTWPEGIVCTFTSNICTLSAISLGWERAFEDGMWAEIDNAGSIEPIWRAFELF